MAKFLERLAVAFLSSAVLLVMYALMFVAGYGFVRAIAPEQPNQIAIVLIWLLIAEVTGNSCSYAKRSTP